MLYEYGGREKLHLTQTSVPQAGNDEVLVKIKSSSVNPVDWKARKGMLRGHRDFHLPLIPGWDLSGVVVEAGSQVSKFKVGDAVYGMPDLTKNGTYAEFIAVKEEYLAPKPEGLSFLEAASIPLVGLTAWQSLIDHADVKPNSRILIHAGAGGVGSFAIQLAKHLGAHVVTTTSQKNEDFVRQLGADEVIDYREHDFAKFSGFDCVFDTVGGATLQKSYKILKTGGTLVTIAGTPDPQLAKEFSVDIKHVEVQPNGQQLEEIRKLLEAGAIKPVVTRYFSLEEIQKAHELSESGHVRGKIGIIVN
nr:NADP-dependent oxidoreductase [Paenactinomyces guangxiensis]